MHNNLPHIFIFLDQHDNQIFKNNITNIGVIYRNYSSLKREKELIKISKACKKKGYKLFISNDIKLTVKFKADGIYLPSFNKTKMYQNAEKRNLIILGSAHNQKEISEKISQKCKAVFLSPIFNVKKKNKFLGIHKFNLLSRVNKINIFALGGINEHNIQKLNLLYVKGFGGISLFKKKPAFKRPVFIKNKFF